MNECTPILDTGLRGAAVASTRISDVNGQLGKLLYRGYLVADLAEKTSYEEIVFLLLNEKLPIKDEVEAISKSLQNKRKLPAEIFSFLKQIPKDTEPMDVLQSSVPLLYNLMERETHKESTSAGKTSSDNASSAIKDPASGLNAAKESALNLIAALCVITCAWDRIRNGKEPVMPRDDLSHAGNFLYMLKGEMPDKEMIHFFDTALVLHAEHSLNASTFTARQVASTKAHMYAAISAAIGSLSGALHGGANVRVMEMLKKIETVDKIDSYIEDTLNAGGLIMGLGHAVYQVDDPRALILAPMSKRVGEIIEDTTWYDLSTEVEKRAKKAFKARKNLDIFVNVDFYSASLFYAMGIPTDLFSPVFAVSRVCGWAAHVIEEQFAQAAAKPALYRPGAAYVGEYCGPNECSFVDIDER
ncbi:GltA4 [Desulfamplus magnetovallimortis]|uniref:Citrate synthase n=1 Tax=Desulfamplus magnetovallimortis TaxID=1246637 RepID=A0A1W1H833_9BACT|nr:citrate/2-methylcitrate synthase [Desulfamplus magnetovallimortis]SLM28629.1 GltA4 [Desulfamplus magnetovallimortis]